VVGGGSRPRKSARRLVLAMAAVVLISALGPTAPVSGEKNAPSADPVLGAAAAKAGVPQGQLDVGDRFTMELPLTGRTLDVAKVIHSATGRVVQVAVDEDGQVVDLDAARRSENAARAARFGKIDPRLAKKMDMLKPQEKIPVSIWVNIPGRRTPRSAASATPAVRLAAVERALAPLLQEVADAIKGAGGSATTPRAAPLVFAKLTRHQIRAVEHHPDVAMIYGPEKYTLFQDDASTTLRANSVWATGNTGAGVRVAVHEPGGVSDTNPLLRINNIDRVIHWCATQSVPDCPKGKNEADTFAHASRVAGAIASTDPLFRGIAPSISRILSENTQGFFGPNLVAANEWGVANGADVTNMSWGTCGGAQTGMSRYIDWAVKYLRQTFTIAAGNRAECPDLKVATPGVAWSAITVGSTLDKDDGFWGNDTLLTGTLPGGAVVDWSNYINPDFAPLMEKPEVVADGGSLRTPGHPTGLSGGSGTSFAAPQVAGVVALMLARQPNQDVWPETNKAAILASAAFHDVVSPTPGDPLGMEKDGVGEVVAYLADRSYRLGYFFNDQMDKGWEASIDHQVQLGAGRKVSVAISWDSITDNPNIGSLPSTDTLAGEDIDLRVLNPDRTTIACQSFSFENAWEQCQFTANVTGTYTFRAQPSDPLAAYTRVGMAYSIWRPRPFCTSGRFVDTGGTFTEDTADGPTYFDRYPGWSGNRADQTGREFVFQYEAPTPTTVTFSDTNTAIDLHALRISPNCANADDPNSPPIVLGAPGSGSANRVEANGQQTLTVTVPADTPYYFVGDGHNGAVGIDTFTLLVK
jgi:hypothetical protein